LGKSAENSAADFLGRWDFCGAIFAFCGRNFGLLATLYSINMRLMQSQCVRWSGFNETEVTDSTVLMKPWKPSQKMINFHSFKRDPYQNQMYI
jgi:hypothetical protein